MNATKRDEQADFEAKSISRASGHADGQPSIGDYVLATKWSDGDPGDPWAVGFYDGKRHEDRHMVIDGDGKQIRHNGYRRVGRIRGDVGAWLLSVAPHLEGCPPGTVNLWTMLTVAASPKARDSTPGSLRDADVDAGNADALK